MTEMEKSGVFSYRCLTLLPVELSLYAIDPKYLIMHLIQVPLRLCSLIGCVVFPS